MPELPGPKLQKFIDGKIFNETFPGKPKNKNSDFEYSVSELDTQGFFKCIPIHVFLQ